MVNGTLLLLIRSFSASLLMQADARYFAWYSAGDMCFYLALKILRRDFLYWAPVSGPGGVALSLITRPVIKTIADYTGIVQFRGSAEMGGIYWSFNMLTAVATPFAVVGFYFSVMNPEKFALTRGTAWRIVGSLSGSWLVSFLLFLKLMKKKYRSTFLSFETGNDWAMSFFLKGDTDAKRVKPLRLNTNKWKKIRPEMKEFVLENWERWEEEQPEWFTAGWKSRVPDDMIPDSSLKELKDAGGGRRRRSSFAELVGGSAPTRRGSATVLPTTERTDYSEIAGKGKGMRYEDDDGDGDDDNDDE